MYALQVTVSGKDLNYEGLLTDRAKIEQLGAHIVIASADIKVKLSYLIAREGPKKGPLVSNNFGAARKIQLM